MKVTPNSKSTLYALLGFCSASILGGCSYDYEVRAQGSGTGVTFLVDSPGGWLKPLPCVDRFEINSTHATVWQIERIRADKLPRCGNDFPLIYGRLPPGFRTVVAPARLEPGILYNINGFGRVTYHGSFRL